MSQKHSGSTQSFPLRILAFLGRKLRRTPLARSVLLNKLHAALSLRLHSSREAQFGPFRVRLDPRDRFIAKKLALYGEYDKHEIALLCSHVKPGDHVMDVGANIGLYSLHLSRAVGNQGKVVAVEPDPDNLRLLQTNLEINGCNNVHIFPCAFGTETGSIDLYQVDSNRGNLSFADLGNTGKSTKVPVRRGEDALSEIKIQPSVVKMDVEGAEPLVFSGLGYLPDVIFFEFFPELLKKLDQDPRAFLEILAAEHYKLELVDPDTGMLTAASPAEIISSTDRHHSTRTSNILATR